MRSVCLGGSESYVGYPASGDSPLRSRLRAAIEIRPPFHLVVVEDGCDATITIDASGEVLSAEYLGAGLLYSGAR